MQIVEMVHAYLKPSDILTRTAFLNAIRVNSAIGGSTNAPIHLNAIARHIGVELTLEDCEEQGADAPQNGTAHISTPATHAHILCHLLLEHQKQHRPCITR